jgi:hypothetical protein
MGRGTVDNSELARWRALPALDVLKVLADHIKEDPDFIPLTRHNASRWHVNVAGRDYEFLCEGPKFYDTRQKRGGGGAIDLAMYVYGLDFKAAVGRLKGVL